MFPFYYIPSSMSGLERAGDASFFCVKRFRIYLFIYIFIYLKPREDFKLISDLWRQYYRLPCLRSSYASLRTQSLGCIHSLYEPLIKKTGAVRVG